MPLLRIRNLRKSYGGAEVLRGVSLDVHKGEVVAVLGASGSGKSTMLRCINCLEMPDAGAVFFHDELIGFTQTKRGVVRLRERRIAEQRAKMGMVFQNFNLFPHWTVLKNVMNAPVRVARRSRGNATQQAMELLDRVGLADRASSYPRQLSGGQQQRVAIARALAMQPEILLLDEPTSALDPANIGEVTDVMKELADAGSTMVVVTHEIGFARAAADHVVFVHDGMILEYGAARQVLEHPRSELIRDFVTQAPA